MGLFDSIIDVGGDLFGDVGDFLGLDDLLSFDLLGDSSGGFLDILGDTDFLTSLILTAPSLIAGLNAPDPKRS